MNREIIVVAGWGRAILLQLAHPAIAAGVHDHSSFRGSLGASFRRMRSTIGAMLALTFGDTEQMITAAAGINAIHDRVHGRIHEGLREALPGLKPGPSNACEGPSNAFQRAPALAGAYSAHDPDLQRWVHATLLESIPLAYEMLVGPLTSRERDRYCLEAAIMEPLLGMPVGWLPRNSATLDTYMCEMMAAGSISVTDTSRALARALLYPPRWYILWPAFRAMQLLTIGSLPPAIRHAYGFEWHARDVRASARLTTLLRASMRLLPSLAREWPVVRRGDVALRSNLTRDSIPLR